MSIAAVILRNAHICIEKMNTVNILIIIINFSTLFSLCYIFVLLCVVSFLYINQSINLYLSLWLLKRWRSINPYITEGSQVGMSIFVACRIGRHDTIYFFVCGYWSVFYLLTYFVPVQLHNYHPNWKLLHYTFRDVHS